jgi:intracellular septation protein|tara:strand:- start:3331 stop:3909 length:579 start_codon:yes stop_codon:yes gene_type:complete
MQQQPSSSPSTKKMLIEYGPLVLFFVVNSFYGIYIGTAVLVLTTLMAVGYSWVSTRKIPVILAFGCGAVVLFGALTLIFADETFIKIKPTVVSLMIAAGLLIGLVLRRNPLKALLGETMSMELPDRAWFNLTLIWVAMFATIAAANEWAWRNLSTDGWVSFKVFGLTGISLGFGVVIAIYLSQQASDPKTGD